MFFVKGLSLFSQEKSAQSPQIQPLQNLYSFFLPAPTSAFVVPLTFFILFLSSFGCFLEVFFFSFRPCFCKPVFGLALRIIQGIINHSKASCLATTKMDSQSKYKDDIWCGLAHFGQFSPNFCFRYCCLSRVKNIDDHLFPLKQLVGHLFRR